MQVKNTTVEDRPNSHHWFFPHLSLWYLGGDRGELNVSFCECSFLLAYENHFASFISSFSCLQVYGPSVGHKQANKLSWVARSAWLNGNLNVGWGGCCVQGLGMCSIAEASVMQQVLEIANLSDSWLKKKEWQILLVLSCRGQLSKSLDQPYAGILANDSWLEGPEIFYSVSGHLGSADS